MVTMRLIPLRRVSFKITYYSSMQRASIGDITEMGITPPDLHSTSNMPKSGPILYGIYSGKTIYQTQSFILTSVLDNGAIPCPAFYA